MRSLDLSHTNRRLAPQRREGHPLSLNPRVRCLSSGRDWRRYWIPTFLQAWLPNSERFPEFSDRLRCVGYGSFFFRGNSLKNCPKVLFCCSRFRTLIPCSVQGRKGVWSLFYATWPRVEEFFRQCNFGLPGCFSEQCLREIWRIYLIVSRTTLRGVCSAFDKLSSTCSRRGFYQV